MPDTKPDFDIRAFRNALVEWFRREGKDYPWRRTTDPWHILVSELMLQQTTIPTVLGRYERWMRQFPTPGHLASVDEQTALRSWEGLGYYRRVRSLQAIAREIVNEFGGEFPDNPEGLKRLPGIGPYTSGALLSFAFNKAAPIVDANVARVLARIDNYSVPVDSTEGLKYLWTRAENLVDPEHAREFNSAIMELGQTYCRISAPDCLLCPVRSFCSAEQPETLPVKNPKPEITRVEHHDVLYLRGKSILLARCPEGKRHAGMYRFPQREDDHTRSLPHVLKQTYSVTRYKVTRYIHHVTESPAFLEGEELVPLDKVHELPMASPDRKALNSPVLGKLLDHIR